MKHTVLVVDDHEMTRVGLRACAQATGLGEVDWLDADTLSGALAAFAAHRPDLVLLDLKLPDSLGLQGLRRFLAEAPEARVAVFSATEDPVVVEQALALGALGYVPKSARSADILDMVLTLLRGGTLRNVHFHEGADDPLHARPGLLAHWRTLATLTDPAEALRQANRLRLLTALREGAQGARGLNARIEATLSGRRIGTPPAWFPGRLLLVTQNSYRHKLFNGDVGICLPDANGTPLAWFPGEGSDGVRAFHPAALPAHESAFAMTVHKAQGSEFDEVWLQLPRADSRVLSRELVYTGLTRARSALHVAGSAEVIAAALGRHAGRVSGLGWRLASRDFESVIN